MGIPTCVVIWLFAVMGFYEILFALVSFLFLAPAEKNCGAVELQGHMDNAEYIIRSTLLRCSGRVYIIDCGADSQTLLVAELFARSCNRLVLLRTDDAPVVLGENIAQ